MGAEVIKGSINFNENIEIQHLKRRTILFKTRKRKTLLNL